MAQNAKVNKTKPNKQQNKKILQDKSLKKKNPSKKSSSACPWVCGSILLLIAIGGFISYDVHIHGGIFEKSSTGKFLKNTGALPYVEIAWFKTMSCSARGYKWAENNLPIYYEKASVIAKPYINLSCDLYKITRNAFANIWENLTGLIESKTPVVTNFIEQYAPGLPQKIQDFSKGVCTYVSNTSSNVVYVFKTKVFIGTLSPENLSKAFNQTQVAAAKYYSWFHEKIDAYAKIK